MIRSGQSSPVQPAILRLGLGMTAMLMLGGCAAALVPVIAGGLVARQQSDGKPDGQVATSRSANLPPELTAGEAVPPTAPIAQPTAAIAPTAAPAATSARAPDLVAQGDPYAAFARYAADRSVVPPRGEARRSALVDQDSLTAAQPRMSDCGDQPPAVVIDLDPGAAPFDLGDPPLPAPGLAARLAAVRSNGVTVLWAASVPVSSAQQLYTILGATGLDPARTDRLLLLKSADSDSKHLRRIAAARDWCIIAIAGDRRSDFDEVFDFLRDPEGPIARALDPHLGAGWFLVPPPID